jgi:hypothetical protein
MPERGGTTTQSGIFYQNSVAALYLGRLCDATRRPDDQQITQVRVEAPNHVDDIVVTFADAHKAYIQAKENIVSGGNAWKKLWRDFDQQLRNGGFQQAKDRLLLHIGGLRSEHEDLRELCQRARTSENHNEWQTRLSGTQIALVEKIKPWLSPELLRDENILDLFGNVDVEMWPLSHIERDLVPNWMPRSSKSTHEMFRLLRDRVGGIARVRGTFTAQELRTSLKNENPGLRFEAPPDIDSIRSSIRSLGSLLREYKHTIANTGLHIKRGVADEITAWIREDGDDSKNVAMLIDQAGMGKTVVLRDVLCKLESEGVDVLAIKADQQLSDVTAVAEIPGKLGLPYPVEQAIQRLAKLERVAVLIDQIDALSLSLAHDQRALNAVLDLTARLRAIPNVRIILSCRLFDRNSDPRLRQIEIARPFTLDKLSEDEIKNALAHVHLDYDSLAEPTQTVLATPLHLDLFVLAAENEVASRDYLRGIVSLQELYGLIWKNVVLKQAPDAPSESDRREVLNLLTDYMDREQRTSAPQTLLQVPETSRLRQATNWLASVGVLIPGKTEWTFLHQTFFDYCYSRRFVDRGDDVVEVILGSEQAIFERRKLVQIMSYSRGYRPTRYLRDLHRLLGSSNLRYHLYDLLLHWFGALPEPTDEEWVLAQRMLIDPAKGRRLLGAMYGNTGWFNRLRDALLPSWLLSEEEVDSQIIPYLSSMAEVAQAQVVELVRPYVGRSDEWDNRINRIVSGIRHWHSTEAIELFEQCFYRSLSRGHVGSFQLGMVAHADPRTGCRLIRFEFDQVLNQYLEKRRQERSELGERCALRLSGATLYQELGLLADRRLEDSLKSVSQAEPRVFVETMMPWLERAMLSSDIPDDEQVDRYIWDALSSHWYEDAFRARRAFIHSFIASLSELAKSEPTHFRQVAARLAEMPFKTPQQLLACVYRTVPRDYASDACGFLLDDRRRLDLGDHEQYESRQLIKAIYPHLSDEQRERLEAYILAYAPIHRYLGVNGLRWRGIEQLHLLQSIPRELLSPAGISRLREWERKFPGIRASESPLKSEGGFVSSPIPEDIARKMSNTNWLSAMRKYQGAVEHKEFLKGGARQLSQVLGSLIKEDPDRFYRLFQQVPDDVDDAYVSAFIDGLAESSASAEWLFDLVRRFAPQEGRDIKRAIAWALEKRIDSDIPEDIVDLLNSYVRESPGRHEWWWSTGENHGDVYSSYLNSDRGSAFHTLMRVFDHRNNSESLRRKWELIEFAATDSSTAFRVGAIYELTYMIGHNRNRAISLFEKLMDGHEVLLESRYVREFLYWAFYRNYLRLQSYIVSMMNHKLDDVQEQGAQLACIAALSTGAMESVEAQKAARDLAEQAMTGPPAWRRGAARIYSRNISGRSMDVCKGKIISLLDDEDEQVLHHIGCIFFSLGSEHFFALRDFIEAYAVSAGKFEHQFAQYLWEHGLLDPAWTLSIVRSILGNARQESQRPWLSGIEDLIRLVLRIQTDPTADKELRWEAMDIFDMLMERHSDYARKVLSEWDRR